MLLYFLRHADAANHAASDFLRPLTPKGITQAEKVADFCASQSLLPDFIYHSPYLRAAQTAKILHSRFPATPIQEEPILGCGMTPSSLCDRINALRELSDHSSLFLVGHEPDFSQSIETLLGITGGYINIRKASLTCLEIPPPFSPATACLHFSLPVKFLNSFSPIPF